MRLGSSESPFISRAPLGRQSNPAGPRKLVELVEQLATKSYKSLTEPQKAAAKLRFAQTMIMGRFGKAALGPFRGLIAQGGGKPTRAPTDCLERRRQILPNIAPRAIKAAPEGEPERPVRIYPDAAGEGNMAGLVIFPRGSDKLPLVSTSQADRDLPGSAAWTD